MIVQTNSSESNGKDSKTNIRIAQLNVEGLTRSKSEIMGKIFQGADYIGNCKV